MRLMESQITHAWAEGWWEGRWGAAELWLFQKLHWCHNVMGKSENGSIMFAIPLPPCPPLQLSKNNVDITIDDNAWRFIVCHHHFPKGASVTQCLRAASLSLSLLTCDGNLTRPLGRSVEHHLLDGVHVLEVRIGRYAEHGPVIQWGGGVGDV